MDNPSSEVKINSAGLEFSNPAEGPANLPISQVGVAGDYMYTWGFGAEFDVANPEPGMRKVFDHVKALLASRGLGFEHVVKTTVLIAPIESFGAYNELYKEYLQSPYPCRTTIPVPSDTSFLEIDVVAYKPGLSS